MASFIPEFAQHWLAGSPAPVDGGQHARPDDAREPDTQDNALEALAERVYAARSIL